LDERKHKQGDAEGRAERAGQVESGACVAWVVGGDERERQQRRRSGEGHVDEEHRFPAECMREDAAEQHADNKAGRACPAPNGQRAISLATFGKRRVDERQSGGKDECPAESLHGSRAEEERRHRRKPTGERGASVEREPRHEDPAPPEQVSGTAAEQQETG
jgi:hypothetical protein